MFDVKDLDTKKKPNFTLVSFKKKEVKQLETFYKQGDIWYSTKTGKRERKEVKS
jgi:hypothetical protein